MPIHSLYIVHYQKMHQLYPIKKLKLGLHIQLTQFQSFAQRENKQLSDILLTPTHTVWYYRGHWSQPTKLYTHLLLPFLGNSDLRSQLWHTSVWMSGWLTSTLQVGKMCVVPCTLPHILPVVTPAARIPTGPHFTHTNIPTTFSALHKHDTNFLSRKRLGWLNRILFTDISMKPLLN